MLCLSMMVSAVARHGWKLLRLSTSREDTNASDSKAALVASGCSDVLAISWQMVLQPLAEWMWVALDFRSASSCSAGACDHCKVVHAAFL